MKNTTKYSYNGETEINGIIFDIEFTYDQEIFGDGIDYPVDSEDSNKELNVEAFYFEENNVKIHLSRNEIKPYVPQLLEYAKQYATEV